MPHSDAEEKLATNSDVDSVGILRSPVDISKVEASDTVQSHLSTSYSSKRTRISANLDAGGCGRMGYVSSTDTALPVAHPHAARKELLALLWPPSISCIPTGRSPIRWDRSSSAAALKFLLLLYCGLSCVVGITQLYTKILNPPSLRPFHAPLTKGNLDIKTMEHYLTRSLIPSSPRLEPFVFSNKQTNSSVTMCTWLNEKDLHLLSKWPVDWQESISLLVTTAAVPASQSHRNLLKIIHESIRHSGVTGISVHILYVGENHTESPNTYLNLARLFALTDWTLLFPGGARGPLSQAIFAVIPSFRERRDNDIYVFKSINSDAYPFPALSPLLLRSRRDFWCTERVFLRTSRASDSSECLWQVSLETTGKMRFLDLPPAEQDINDIYEGPLSKRLSTRFRGEMCDIVLKQIALVYPRGRCREDSLEWVKSFCTKTVHKKFR